MMFWRKRVILSNPQFDTSAYSGRVMHYFRLTNPLNLLVSANQLKKAKDVMLKNKQSGGVVPSDADESDLWNQKYIYESSYNPITGEQSYAVTRRSAEIPINTFLIACMLRFYKTNAQAMFFQWLNQTFNAGLYFTNHMEIKNSTEQQQRLLASYIYACGGAWCIALFLRKCLKRSFCARFIPFAAVAGAHCITVPVQRSEEISKGVSCFTKYDYLAGKSTNAALFGTALAVLSRVLIAAPPMVLPALTTKFLEKRGFYCYFPKYKKSLPLMLMAVLTLMSTPLGYALIPNMSSINVDYMEDDLKLENNLLGFISTEEWLLFSSWLKTATLATFMIKKAIHDKKTVTIL